MVATAKAAGCPPDQLRNFLRAGCVPFPWQFRFHAACRECDKPNGPTKVGAGGAAGPGKSFSMLAQIGLDDCQRVPGAKWLYLRKVGKAAKEGFEDLRVRLFQNVPHKYNRQEGILYFTNGSRIVIGHFQHESDVDNYLGLEYDGIGIEEATTLSARKERFIGSRMRSVKPGWKPRRYYSFNPGGIGHAHIKAMLYEPYRREKQGLERQSKTRFIPATIDDNPLVNEGYIDELNSLVGWELQAYRYGNMDIAAGQFFINWRDEIHVAKRYLAIEPGWYVWIAKDYGFVHWDMTYLLAETGDGDIHVIDEHGARGWLPEQHVQAYDAMLTRHGLQKGRIREMMAGADMFSKDDEGKTTAEKYKALGWEFKRANVDRVNGASELLHRLGSDDAQQPVRSSILISPRCSRLIACIPMLQHDPNRGEDVLKWDADENGDGGDDPYDALRYGIMQRQYTPAKGFSKSYAHEEDQPDPRLLRLGLVQDPKGRSNRERMR